jgi:hypothetical protein
MRQRHKERPGKKEGATKRIVVFPEDGLVRDIISEVPLEPREMDQAEPLPTPTRHRRKKPLISNRSKPDLLFAAPCVTEPGPQFPEFSHFGVTIAAIFY